MSKCSHDYHIIETENVNSFRGKYIMLTVYCPKCGLTNEKTQSEWNRMIKKKEIKEQYFK